MSETTQPSSETDQPTETPAVQRSDDHRLHRLVLFGRRHPVLTTLGLTGAALFGGVEVAFGALIGATVATMIRRSNGAPKSEPQQAREPEPAPRPTPSEPAKTHGLRERAIAVMHAALGDSTLAPQPKQAR